MLPRPTIPDPLLSPVSRRGHCSQALGVGSHQSLSLPASSGEVRALARTQAGRIQGISPLFPEDGSLRLLVHEGEPPERRAH